MRVENGKLTIVQVEIKKDIAVDIENEVLANEEMSAVELSEEAGYEAARRSFITILDEQSSVLETRENRIGMEKEKQSILEMVDLCKEVASHISEEDYYRIVKEGYDPTKLTPEKLKGLITDYTDMETKATMDVSKTDNNVKLALTMSECIRTLNDEQIYTLLGQGKEPTIENLYKSKYLMTGMTTDYKTGKMEESTWEELLPSASEALKKAGYDTTKENFEIVRNLIEHDVCVNKDTILIVKDLKELSSNYSEQEIVKRIAPEIKCGKEPVRICLVDATKERAKEVVDKLSKITDVSISKAIETNVPLTINNLYQLSIEGESLMGDVVTKVTQKSTQKLYVEKTDRATDTATPAVMDRKEIETSNQKTSALENVFEQDYDTQNQSKEMININQNSIQRPKQKIEHIPNQTQQKGQEVVAEVKASTDQTLLANHEIERNKKGYQDLYREDDQRRLDEAEITKEKPHIEKEEIRAHRQLEEIRLKMTLEASTKLMRKGIDVDTTRLSEVVEELRALERESIRESLRYAEVEVSEENIKIVQATNQAVYELSKAPAILLGQTLTTMDTETLTSLSEKQSVLRSRLQHANQTYESMLTRPDKEYKDSIQKAFSNMDGLLEELQIEPTEENKRAIRILSYNEMELTSQNIDDIKAYDEKVRNVIENLRPHITVELIRQKINPLSESIPSLSEKTTRIMRDMGPQPEETYAKFLHRLEQHNEISEDEREAYVGVYRLLYQIDKSDGKALGRVVKANQELTLRNMLTAIRSERANQMNYVVDDDNGKASIGEKSNRDIEEQINQVFDQEDLTEQKQTIQKLYAQLEVMPELHEKLKEDMVHSGSTKENVWDGLKDLSLDELLAKLTQEGEPEKHMLYTSEKAKLQEVLSNCEDAVSFLHRLKEPSTPENIMLVNQMFGYVESEIEKTKKSKEENISVVLKKMNRLSDTFSSKQELLDGYEDVEETVTSLLDEAVKKEQKKAEQIELLTGLKSQISFAKRLASKESYYLPYVTEDGITNVNVTILRNTGDQGTLQMMVSSEQIGKVRVNVRMHKETAVALIESDNRAVLEQLKPVKKHMEQVLKENEMQLKQFNLSFEPHLGEHRNLTLQRSLAGKSASSQHVTTLYRIAKVCIQDMKKVTG